MVLKARLSHALSFPTSFILWEKGMSIQGRQRKPTQEKKKTCFTEKNYHQNGKTEDNSPINSNLDNSRPLSL